MKRNLVVLTAFVVIGSLTPLVSQSTKRVKAAAAATPLLGQWIFVSTTDSTGKLYSRNGICIKGDGTWYATTSHKGSGHWYMKPGSRSIHLHGNYEKSLADGAVNDSFELTVGDSRPPTGYLQEWNDDGSYSGYYTTTWTFSSPTCAPASE